MNCEHGVDIDEYTCSDCSENMESYWDKEKKERQKAIRILSKYGLQYWVKSE